MSHATAHRNTAQYGTTRPEHRTIQQKRIPNCALLRHTVGMAGGRHRRVAESALSVPSATTIDRIIGQITSDCASSVSSVRVARVGRRLNSVCDSQQSSAYYQFRACPESGLKMDRDWPMSEQRFAISTCSRESGRLPVCAFFVRYRRYRRYRRNTGEIRQSM